MENLKNKNILKIALTFMLIFTLSFTLFGCTGKMSEEEKAQCVEAINAGATETEQAQGGDAATISAISSMIINIQPMLAQLDFDGVTKIKGTVAEFRAKIEKNGNTITCKAINIVANTVVAYAEANINYDFDNKTVISMQLYLAENAGEQINAMSASLANHIWSVATSLEESVKAQLQTKMTATFNLKVTKEINMINLK